MNIKKNIINISKKIKIIAVKINGKYFSNQLISRIDLMVQFKRLIFI